MPRIEELTSHMVEDRPRCDASITDKGSQMFRQQRTPGDNRCLRQSSYRLDGRCYCGQHAGVEAIKVLLRG